tara:strand:+ start:147 stop:1151 length:1005 start_codon:yes stop_codon:yes gene_type:complete
MKKILLFTIITCFVHQNLFSQDNLDEFFNTFLVEAVDGSLHDSEVILEGFMSPLGASLGSGLNAGWYNTAKTHGLGRFDVTAGIHFIGFPNEAKSFNPSNELNDLVISGGPDIPTFIGGASDAEIGWMINNEFVKAFDAPRGTKLAALPVPYFQGSIGLIKKTELLFRLSPLKIDFGQLELGYWGLGFKHDIMQWIPIAKRLPIDCSILAGYSNLSSSFNFYEDQSMDFSVQAFTTSLTLSKKLSFLTLYTGFGYNYSSSNLQLNGEYIIGNPDDNLDEVTLIDPLDLDFGGINGLKANLGVRMKLLIFTLHAQYTKAEYDIFTIGLGLNADWK